MNAPPTPQNFRKPPGVRYALRLPIPTGVPVAGLFLSSVPSILRNRFAYPDTMHYNSMNIPVAHPPFGPYAVYLQFMNAPYSGELRKFRCH